MKNFRNYSIIVFAFLILVSCSKTQFDNDKSKGYVNLVISQMLPESSLKSTDTDDLTPKSAILSIKDIKGEYIYNSKKFDLYKFGEGYLTEKIELEESEYTIEDFLILNSDDSVIYLTPKINSEFENLVSTPLPLTFSVLKNDTTEVILDVVSYAPGFEEKYGYVIFSFNVIKTLEFQPGSEGIDAYIEDWELKDYRNTNFGNHPEFQSSVWTGSNLKCVVRSLVKFDLSSIPSDTKIIHANLCLYPSTTGQNGIGHSTISGSNEFVLKKVTSDWIESTVTWNNQPTTTDVGEILLPASDSTLQNYIIDVSDLVQEMIVHPENNFGMMIQLQDESYYYRRILFASGDNVEKDKHPKLLISYN